MKRLILTAVIACILVGACLLGVYCISNECDALYDRLAGIEALCRADDAELAQACQALEAYWCKIEPRLTFFVNHQTARTIGESIAMLPPLSASQDKAEFLSECRVAKIKVEHLKQMERASWQNVF